MFKCEHTTPSFLDELAPFPLSAPIIPIIIAQHASGERVDLRSDINVCAIAIVDCHCQPGEEIERAVM